MPENNQTILDNSSRIITIKIVYKQEETVIEQFVKKYTTPENKLGEKIVSRIPAFTEEVS